MEIGQEQFRNAGDGLDFEAELFAGSGPKASIWSCEDRALVCPKAYRKRVNFADAVSASEARGWPVFQRPTGGGIVPQGDGVVNLVIAFNAPKKFTIEDGYRLLVSIIQSGFGDKGHRLEPGDTPGSYCDGDWNLSVDGKKVVGTAQRWRPVRGGRPRVLAHALILTDTEVVTGAKAVADMHADLGLDPVSADAQTNIQLALGLTQLPTDALLNSAQRALGELETENI